MLGCASEKTGRRRDVSVHVDFSLVLGDSGKGRVRRDWKGAAYTAC